MADRDRAGVADWARRLLSEQARETTGSTTDATESLQGATAPASGGATVPASELAPHHRRTIDRAVHAIDDVEQAASFAAGGGIADLARAVRAAENADTPEVAARGHRALERFERFRRAARGQASAQSSDEEPLHSPHWATS